MNYKIYSTFIDDNALSEAADNLKENEIQYSEDDLYYEAHMIKDFVWNEEIFPVLKDYFDNHKCIVRGSVGRWNGRYDGGDVTESYNDLMSMLNDCYDIEIYIENGLLTIYGYHHDGSLTLRVKELTDHGYEWYRNSSFYFHGSDCLHYLFDFNFNSRKTDIEFYC